MWGIERSLVLVSVLKPLGNMWKKERDLYWARLHRPCSYLVLQSALGDPIRSAQLWVKMWMHLRCIWDTLRYDQTTFGGVSRILRHSFSSVYMNVSWVTLTDRLLNRCSLHTRKNVEWLLFSFLSKLCLSLLSFSAYKFYFVILTCSNR